MDSDNGESNGKTVGSDGSKGNRVIVICTHCGTSQDDTMHGRTCLCCCNICTETGNAERNGSSVASDGSNN
jgi:hypothetical protein